MLAIRGGYKKGRFRFLTPTRVQSIPEISEGNTRTPRTSVDLGGGKQRSIEWEEGAKEPANAISGGSQNKGRRGGHRNGKQVTPGEHSTVARRGKEKGGQN